MLSRFTLRSKLVLLFMVMALLVAGTGIFGLLALERTSDLLEVYRSTSARQKIASLMKVTLQGGRANLLEAVMASDPDDFEIFKIDYELKRETFLGQCDLLLKGAEKLHIPAVSADTSLGEKIGQVRKAFNAMDEISGRLLARKEELLSRKGEDAALDHLVSVELPAAVEGAGVAVDDLLVEVGKGAIEADEEAALLQYRSGVAFAVVIAGAIALAIVLGLFATRSMVLRIRAVGRSLDRGAEGDLTAAVRVDSADELGLLGSDFNRMLENLSGMMGKVKSSTGELGRVADEILAVSREVIASAEVQQSGVAETSAAVTRINDSQQGITQAMEILSRSSADATASIVNMARNIQTVARDAQELAGAVDEISSCTTEMAAALQQVEGSANTVMYAATTTASSIAQMDNSIQEVERNAQQTALISERVYRDAEEGRKTVEATIEGMQEIRRSSRTTFEAIETLSTTVEGIGLILSVIDEVADQTKLLSLNAAIIAAQAGEHGRGFAVVADEIKRLADRTIDSTREITNLIEQVQEETGRAVQAIRKAEGTIAEGESLSAKSGEALNKIVAGAEEAGKEMAGVARATKEQAKGSQVIGKAIERVSEMIHQIVTATHEQAKASESIRFRVDRMAELTSDVRESTRHQSAEGEQISRLSEDIIHMVRQIRESCAGQNAGTVRIAEAVGHIEQSTRKNLSSAQAMGETLGTLSRQVTTLKQEVGKFTVRDASRRTEAAPPAPPSPRPGG